MAKPQNASGTTARAERRSGQDRRRVDKGPPGLRDRRRSVEPRRPDVAEIELSAAEWQALHEAIVPPAAPVPAPADGAEPAGPPRDADRLRRR
jgi:hypothetical protein